MTIYYVVNARIPSEHAHGLQIMNMCAAFAAHGHDVTLIVPRRRNAIREDAFAYYGVERTFPIVELPVIDLVFHSVPGSFALLAFTFARSVRRYLRGKEGVVYTRGETVLFGRFFLSGQKFVWETHIKPDTISRYGRAARGVSLFVAATKYYAEEIPRLWHVDSARVVYAPDAVDLRAFMHPEEKQAARRRLGLSADKRIVLYIGALGGWKGIEYLCKAAALLPPDTKVACIGGSEEEVREWRGRYPHVSFLGFRPHRELADNQAAADVLVLTGDPASTTAQRYTSPLKLFTYMASGRPIVAFDLPAFRDVLTDATAFFCKPEPAAVAGAIREALESGEEASRRASSARRLAEAHTWEKRAAHIAEAIARI